MATTNIEIRHTKDFYPRVVNLMANNNRVDKIVFTLDPYVQDDVDLSAYDCYIMTYGVNGIDEAKLTYSIDGTKMAIEWNIDNYTLSTGQVLSFQVAFKSQDNSAAVWHSYKGIAFSNASIDADEHIASNSPTILRQFEMKIDNMAATVTNAYVVMPYNDYIPVASRAPGKFYINRLNDYDYSCLLETADGNVLKFSADAISYDPVNSGLLANTVQDAIDNLGKRINGLNRFCINDGNYTDGVEDLLQYSGTILTYKVGNEYPDLIATKADGVTFTRNRIAQQDVSGYEDGVYNIFIDEESTEILNNSILQAGSEAAAVSGDVVYDSLIHEAKKYEATALSPQQKYITDSGNYRSIATNGSIYVACGTSGEISTSPDLETWTRRSSGTSMELMDVIWTGTSFIVVGQYGTIVRSDDGITWTVIKQGVAGTHNSYIRAVKGNNKIIACGSGMLLSASTDDGITWTDSTLAEVSNSVQGLAYGNSLYVAVCNGGVIYASSDGAVWDQVTSVTTDNLEDIVYANNRFVVCTERGKVFYSADGQSWTLSQTNTTAQFNAISYTNGFYYCAGTLGVLFVSKDLVTWQQVDTANNYSLNGAEGDVIVGNGRLVYQLTADVAWINFTKTPLGVVTIENGAIANVYTHPYNYTVHNGVVATTATYGLLRVASNNDINDCTCTDAGITPSNLYDIIDLRKANTEYYVGDIVGCAYHAEWNLQCTTAGTTSSDHLDTTGKFSTGDTIVDGNVVWTIVPAGGGSGGSGWTDNPMIATGDMVIGGAVEDEVATPVRFGAPINDGTYYHTVTVSGGAPVHSWGEAGAVTTAATLKYWE